MRNAGVEHVHMAGGQEAHTHSIFWRWNSSLLCFPSPIKGWNEPLESTVYPGEMNALAAFQLVFLSFYSKQTIGQK